VPRTDDLANTVTSSPTVENLIIDPFNNVVPKDQKNTTALRTNWFNGNAYIKKGKKNVK
jgi:hypothetical protein